MLIGGRFTGILVGRRDAAHLRAAVARQPARVAAVEDRDEAALVRQLTVELGELRVHALGGLAQRQLAQRDEVAFPEEVADGLGRLLGDVDLAFPQPLNQVVRRQIDQFDRVRAVEYRIRHGLAHPHMRDLGDHVVEAFEMLDVQCGPDVDAGSQQFLDVLPALGVAAARHVGVRQLVQQEEGGAARKRVLERLGQSQRN